MILSEKLSGKVSTEIHAKAGKIRQKMIDTPGVVYYNICRVASYFRITALFLAYKCSNHSPGRTFYHNNNKRRNARNGQQTYFRGFAEKGSSARRIAGRTELNLCQSGACERLQGGRPMKTFMASPATIERKWYVVDAADMTLGRLAAGVASVLRGKNKPTFTPHIDTGDYVIIVNADKVKVTGKKLDQKIYYHHSEYVGGMKETTLREMLAKKPERVVEHAVKGMLPKGPLGREMYKKLFVYAGPDHKQQAQKPETLTF